MNIKNNTKILAYNVNHGEVFEYDSEYWMRVKDDEDIIVNFHLNDEILAVSLSDGILLEISKKKMVTVVNAEVVLT